MHKEINLFLSGKMTSGLLLCGNTSIPSLLKDAYLVAAKLLNCNPDRVLTHPDFLLIEKSKKSNTLGVDSVNELLALEELKAGHAKRFVVLIKDFHLLTIQAQNRLLKILEDGDNVVVIGLCTEENSVLATIKSRLRIIRYSPVSKDQYLATGKTIFEYYLANGFLEIQPEQSALIVVQSCMETVLDKKPEQLLCILHLLKEKDKENFFDKFTYLVKPLWLCFGEIIVTSLQKEPGNRKLYNSLKVVQTAIIRSDKHYYTRDSFFLDIVTLIETLK